MQPIDTPTLLRETALEYQRQKKLKAMLADAKLLASNEAPKNCDRVPLEPLAIPNT